LNCRSRRLTLLSAGRDRSDQQEENKATITHIPILSEVPSKQECLEIYRSSPCTSARQKPNIIQTDYTPVTKSNRGPLNLMLCIAR
jgi:hypothetical protein